MLQNTLWRVSPRLSCAISYIHNRHRLPNFSHPRDLSEIVFNMIITGENKKFVPYVDKIEVRKYIEKWGLGSYLPLLYGVWEKGDDINFDELPNKFALKSNNYCGGHLFCHDKASWDIEYAKRHMDEEISKASNEIRESQYNMIPPRVFAEELIEDPNHLQPIDYKFMCCDNQVRGCLVVLDRGTKGGPHFLFYDNQWKKQDDFLRGPEKSFSEVPQPSNYQEMVSIVQQICSHFNMVRVDLYSISGRIFIGELTFTPEGGMMSYFTNKAVDYLGHK